MTYFNLENHQFTSTRIWWINEFGGLTGYSLVLVHYIGTVDPHLSGLHLSGGSDYPDTKFSRDSHLRVSFLGAHVCLVSKNGYPHRQT